MKLNSEERALLQEYLRRRDEYQSRLKQLLRTPRPTRAEESAVFDSMLRVMVQTLPVIDLLLRATSLHEQAEQSHYH